MFAPSASGALPSLLRTTIRRSVGLGRLYLGIGVVYTVILPLSLSAAGESSFDSSVPILLPIFFVLGSMGGMVVFSNDRLKGVFEYLIAYGVRPFSIFAYSLIASLAVMSILVGISLAVVLGVSWSVWHVLPVRLLELLGLYSLPMGYASASLACTVGMYWTVLSSPREGMNNPIGLIPLVGIAPSIVALVVVGAVGSAFGGGAVLVALGVTLIIVLAIALVLLSQVGRLLRRERLLSPM